VYGLVASLADQRGSRLETRREGAGALQAIDPSAEPHSLAVPVVDRETEVDQAQIDHGLTETSCPRQRRIRIHVDVGLGRRAVTGKLQRVLGEIPEVRRIRDELE
jgi:hypothetical protein